MSGRTGHRKRLVCVTAGNLRQNHLSLTGHDDFFPADCYGAAAKTGRRGKLLRLDIEGIPEPVLTDIPTDAKSGRPRRFFRNRAWAREFFAKHGVKPGDTVAIERIRSHRFRIWPFDAKEERQCPTTFRFDQERQGDGHGAIETLLTTATAWQVAA